MPSRKAKAKRVISNTEISKKGEAGPRASNIGPPIKLNKRPARPMKKAVWIVKAPRASLGKFFMRSVSRAMIYRIEVMTSNDVRMCAGTPLGSFTCLKR